MVAERLFCIYLELLPGERVTAADLAEAAGASERTVYRDIERLVNAGLSIQGAPGIGYRLLEPPEFAPLLLSLPEMRALVAGATEIAASGDDTSAKAAAALLDKVRAIVPPRSRAKLGLKS